MKSKILKNISFALISLILIILIFFSGYFVGQAKDKYALAPANISGTVSASNEIDFAPFWKVWNLLEEKFISAADSEKTSDEEKLYGAISGLVNSVGDPYTVFLPPAENENFETSIQGEFSGVGMEIGLDENNILTVIAPLKDTPAERSGMQPGDKVLEIDGASSAGLSLDEAVDKIRGPINTAVVLKVRREGVAELFDVSITRGTINIPTLDTELRDDGVFVISLYTFSANSALDFRGALREFAESKKSRLLIDLRGNPGGFLDSAVDISSWFLPAGKIIVQEDFGTEVKDFRSKGNNVFNDNLKLVILVNKGSASASEIVAGALQEHGIAKLVGTKTFGKGSVQQLIDITPETSLKVTIARWLTPNGNSISDGGLTPDYLVEEAPEGVDLFDHQLNEAVRILKEM